MQFITASFWNMRIHGKEQDTFSCSWNIGKTADFRDRARGEVMFFAICAAAMMSLIDFSRSASNARNAYVARS